MRITHISSLDHLLPQMALDNMEIHIYITAKEKDPVNMTVLPIRVEHLDKC
jgi:hypothetical protein